MSLDLQGIEEVTFLSSSQILDAVRHVMGGEQKKCAVAFWVRLHKSNGMDGSFPMAISTPEGRSRPFHYFYADEPNVVLCSFGGKGPTYMEYTYGTFRNVKKKHQSENLAVLNPLGGTGPNRES